MQKKTISIYLYCFCRNHFKPRTHLDNKHRSYKKKTTKLTHKKKEKKSKPISRNATFPKPISRFYSFINLVKHKHTTR